MKVGFCGVSVPEYGIATSIILDRKAMRGADERLARIRQALTSGSFPPSPHVIAPPGLVSPQDWAVFAAVVDALAASARDISEAGRATTVLTATALRHMTQATFFMVVAGTSQPNSPVPGPSGFQRPSQQAMFETMPSSIQNAEDANAYFKARLTRPN